MQFPVHKERAYVERPSRFFFPGRGESILWISVENGLKPLKFQGKWNVEKGVDNVNNSL